MRGEESDKEVLVTVVSTLIHWQLKNVINVVSNNYKNSKLN